MIVPKAMLKTADHIKSHVMMMTHVGMSVSLRMIGWGAGLLCMIDWELGPCYMILMEAECLLMIG